MTGKIIKNISNDYTVSCNDKLYVCKVRGKIRTLDIKPLVGDVVDFDEKNNYILEIKERKNYLNRPPIANVDQAFVITSVKEPDFSSNLLDKLLNIIEFNNIKYYNSKLQIITESREEQPLLYIDVQNSISRRPNKKCNNSKWKYWK